MLQNQKLLFNLSGHTTYLNGAYMSPQLRSVEKVGIEGLIRKADPSVITEADFFSGRKLLKQRFAQLIEAPDPESVAIIPSVSYGIASALKNIPFQPGDEIVVLEEQFPSNYYAWKQLEKEKKVRVITISAPPVQPGRAKLWNDAVLQCINARTRAVAIPIIHWADGTIFALDAISNRVREVDAYFIIDGTQSIGAMPFSVASLQPDAVICAGYKWLLGPYSLGMAYYGERLYEGIPIENNWIIHVGSENFAKLVHYNEDFKPKANRYDVGESSNFILTPMLSESIRQVLEWTPKGIQQYCQDIATTAVEALRETECFIEDDAWRAHHLFGIYLRHNDSIERLKKTLSQKNIFVSYRGNAIRVSPNVYNTREDMELLASCFREEN